MRNALVFLSVLFVSAAAGAATSNTFMMDTRTEIDDSMTLQYSPLDAGEVTVSIDGAAILSSTNAGAFVWQPQSLGNHTLTHAAGTNSWDCTVKVTGYDFFVQSSPNPPMAEDDAIAITPVTRTIPQTGGAAAISTSGSGSWTAAASDSWITLNSTSGSAGYPVAYSVGLNANIEDRTGYVYVSGHTHTVTQAGIGATLGSYDGEWECDGGTKSVRVVAQNQMTWQARPNADWISVSPTQGSGEMNVTITVAPWHDVSTRSATLTIAGKTYTVFQYGRRIKLSSYSSTCDYLTHAIPITVNALAITDWSVTPQASWISVVDGGNGRGGDTVTIAVAENPSYKARTGKVTIGTEEYTVTQQGRTDLVFTISPASTTASRDGANGLVGVTATPDLPWSASADANWVTLNANYTTGAGNGNIPYTVSPNSTLSQRTAKITVVPAPGCGMPTRTHTITQAAAVSAISSTGYEFEAAGESTAVEVTVANIVEWSISESLSWITVSGSTSRVGPGTVTLVASANNTVEPRSGTVKIAGKTFAVRQKARSVTLEYDTKLFGTDGGWESVSIHPDGNASWTAVVSDPTWITILNSATGTGDAEIEYVISPYTGGDGQARTGTIRIGDKVVYITQRAYDLSINPTAEWKTGNAGAGEIGVSAGIGDVWTAIATEPWITFVTDYDSGTGNGVVRFSYTENDTGKQRTGKIVIAGEVYTLTQAARVMVAIGAVADGGGMVSGAGSYDLGSNIHLAAIAGDGYEFAYWTLPGGGESMVNPLPVTVDVAKSYTAHFVALTPEFTSCESSTNGVALAWTNLAWAAQYKVYRGEAAVPSSAEVIATIVADGTHSYLDATGEIDVPYWYWVEAVGASDDTMSLDAVSGKRTAPPVFSPITYADLRGTTHSNPATYEEGKSLGLSNPVGSVTGYTFAGWSPAAITSAMKGAQTVTALWTANSYTIAYSANGGSGAMAPTAAEYDRDATIAANGFSRANYDFLGWATSAGGSVAYGAGETVRNLTAAQGGVVTLYAVWKLAGVAAPVVTPGDGGVFVGDTCEVTITCAMAGASIYYTTNGATPKTSASYLYKGPFTISGDVDIKAVAVLEGVKSAYVTAHIAKAALTLENALDIAGVAGIALSTGGDAEWEPILDAEAQVGTMSVVSGEIGDDEESWIEAAVSGAGTLSYWVRTSCEHDDDGTFTWDHIEVLADGAEVQGRRMDGESGWVQRSVEFATVGAHAVRWVYVKDESDDDGDDCAWLDGLSWTPSEVPVVVDPIPELPNGATPQQVAEALAGSADEANLVANIGDAAAYAGYRAWADGVKDANGQVAGHAAVKACGQAWLSYALASEKLIDEAPAQGDLAICGFDDAGEGRFALTLGLEGIAIGADAKPGDLARAFSIEGADTLGGTFSAEGVTAEFGATTDGKAKALVRPAKPGARFFYRAKLRQ